MDGLINDIYQLEKEIHSKINQLKKLECPDTPMTSLFIDIYQLERENKSKINQLEKWKCPDDEGVYSWLWLVRGNYKKCFRNFHNEVWEQTIDDNGEIKLGKWIGVYDPVTHKMDTYIPAPEFID